MLPLLCYDIIFKSIFQNQENILGKMISDITGIDYDLLKDNLILETNELPIDKRNEKAKRCDFIVKFNKSNILNLELNRQSHTGLLIKNLSYLFGIFSTETKKGKEYDKNLMVMQINLNCFKDKYYKSIKPLMKYHIREDEDNQIYINNLVIYSLNVVKCHEVYYNEKERKIPNYIKWGALIYCNDFSKVPDITKGIMTYEERNWIMDKSEKITKEDYFMTEAEALHWAEWEKNTMYSDGKRDGLEEGMEEGFAQGVYQNTMDMIKNMLKNDTTLEYISKVTNKSIDEIKEIQKMLENE